MTHRDRRRAEARTQAASRSWRGPAHAGATGPPGAHQDPLDPRARPAGPVEHLTPRDPEGGESLGRCVEVPVEVPIEVPIALSGGVVEEPAVEFDHDARGVEHVAVDRPWPQPVTDLTACAGESVRSLHAVEVAVLQRRAGTCRDVGQDRLQPLTTADPVAPLPVQDDAGSRAVVAVPVDSDVIDSPARCDPGPSTARRAVPAASAAGLWSRVAAQARCRKVGRPECSRYTPGCSRTSSRRRTNSLTSWGRSSAASA